MWCTLSLMTSQRLVCCSYRAKAYIYILCEPNKKLYANNNKIVIVIVSVRYMVNKM